MIANISWGRDFGGLVSYLTDHRDHEVLDLRGVSTIEMAAEEMSMVADLSERASSVVCHISFAVAHEDGRLERATWIDHLDSVDAEFQLKRHQRVVVRHRDKAYDHIHVFYCTVSARTGQTPPRQLFIARGAADAGVGALAISKEQANRLLTDQVVSGSWNRHALIRLQQLSRAAEKRLGLRQLRSPREISIAREHGEARPVPPNVARRAERTGARSLLAASDAIRAALDAPNWPTAHAALTKMGFGFEPSFRMRKGKAETIAGLLIYDLSDSKNRLPASQFDLSGRKYGLRQIEKRHAIGAATIDDWWPVRVPEPRLASKADDRQETAPVLKQEFDAARARHRLSELEKAAHRRKLAVKHKRERARLRRKLADRRRRLAARLPANERRAFYSRYARTVRKRAFGMLAYRHWREREPLKRVRMPIWTEFQLARQTGRKQRKENEAAMPSPASMTAIERTSIEETIKSRNGEPAGANTIAPDENVDQTADNERLIDMVHLRGRKGPSR